MAFTGMLGSRSDQGVCWRRPAWGAAGVATGLLLALWLVEGDRLGAAPADTNVAYRKTLLWKPAAQGSQNEGAGQGLYFVQASENEMRNRLLVRTPGGRRLVLTGTVLPFQGKETVRLHDDQSGWWIEVTEEHGLTRDNLWKFLQDAVDMGEHVQDEPYPFWVTTSDGLRFRDEIPYEAQPSGRARSLARRLQDAGLAEELRQSIPDALVDPLEFLSAVLQVEGLDLRPPVDLLLEILQESRKSVEDQDSEWTQEATNLKRGVVPTSRNEIEFASSFVSFEPQEPLHGQ